MSVTYYIVCVSYILYSMCQFQMSIDSVYGEMFDSTTTRSVGGMYIVCVSYILYSMCQLQII